MWCRKWVIGILMVCMCTRLHAQALDTARVPLTRDTAYASFVPRGPALRFDFADGSLVSAGAGVARQSQSAFGTIALTPQPTSLASAGLSATGLILRSDDSAASTLLAEGLVGSAGAHADERFFRERAQR